MFMVLSWWQATNLENLEYSGISLNMENSEFYATSGKNCNKVFLVPYSNIWSECGCDLLYCWSLCGMTLDESHYWELFLLLCGHPVVENVLLKISELLLTDSCDVLCARFHWLCLTWTSGVDTTSDVVSWMRRKLEGLSLWDGLLSFRERERSAGMKVCLLIFTFIIRANGSLWQADFYAMEFAVCSGICCLPQKNARIANFATFISNSRFS